MLVIWHSSFFDNTKTGSFTLVLKVKGIHKDPLDLSKSDFIWGLVFQIAVRSMAENPPVCVGEKWGVGSNRKFCLRKFFFIRWWESYEEWFCPFEYYLMLQTTFCKYWTSFKIKISMTCVYIGHEVKKMIQHQWLQL